MESFCDPRREESGNMARVLLKSWLEIFVHVRHLADTPCKITDGHADELSASAPTLLFAHGELSDCCSLPPKYCVVFVRLAKGGSLSGLFHGFGGMSSPRLELPRSADEMVHHDHLTNNTRYPRSVEEVILGHNSIYALLQHRLNQSKKINEQTAEYVRNDSAFGGKWTSKFRSSICRKNVMCRG